RFLTGKPVLFTCRIDILNHEVAMVRYTPRGGITIRAMADVENLTHWLGVVAVLFKVLGQRYGIRERVAESLTESINARRGGTATKEQVVARRPANGLIGIRLFEKQAIFR